VTLFLLTPLHPAIAQATGDARSSRALTAEQQREVASLVRKITLLVRGERYSEALELADQAGAIDQEVRPLFAAIKEGAIASRQQQPAAPAGAAPRDESTAMLRARLDYERAYRWYMLQVLPNMFSDDEKRDASDNLTVLAGKLQPAERAAERVRVDNLQRKFPDVRFDDVAFDDVVDFLRDISDETIFVNWQALAAAGITRDTSVSIRLGEVTFADALNAILQRLGGNTKLGYVRDQGVLTISTLAEIRAATTAPTTAPVPLEGDVIRH
jgi:hypothetical protein